jgi:hypothetical protein
MERNYMNSNIPTNLQTCTKCKIEKPLEEFRRQSSRKNGRKCKCVSCDDEYQKKRYNNKKITFIEKVRQWQAKNEERVKKYKEKYRANKGHNHD